MLDVFPKKKLSKVFHSQKSLASRSLLPWKKDPIPGNLFEDRSLLDTQKIFSRNISGEEKSEWFLIWPKVVSLFSWFFFITFMGDRTNFIYFFFNHFILASDGISSLFLRLKAILDHFGRVKPFLRPLKPFQSHFASKAIFGKISIDFSWISQSNMILKGSEKNKWKEFWGGFFEYLESSTLSSWFMTYKKFFWTSLWLFPE